MFDVHTDNLEVVSYLCISPGKALVKAEKEKKYKYLQPCMESRCYFTPLVLSEDGIPGEQVWATNRRMVLHLRFKLNQEHS